MTQREFPACCGIRVLTEFGNTNTAMVTKKFTKEEVDVFLKELYKSSKLDLIAINEEQIKALGLEVFIENGFKVLEKFYYEGHKNNIWLLSKHNGITKPE